MTLLFKMLDTIVNLDDWLTLAKESGMEDELSARAEIEKAIAAVSKNIFDWRNGFAFSVHHAEQPHIIVATAFLRLSALDVEHSASAWHIAVKKDCRKQGIGAFLMGNLCQFAKQHGKTMLLLYTTTGADFYKKCGFEEYGRLPNVIDLEENGVLLDRVYLYKRLYP